MSSDPYRPRRAPRPPHQPGYAPGLAPVVGPQHQALPSVSIAQSWPGARGEGDKIPVAAHAHGLLGVVGRSVPGSPSNCPQQSRPPPKERAQVCPYPTAMAVHGPPVPLTQGEPGVRPERAGDV